MGTVDEQRQPLASPSQPPAGGGCCSCMGSSDPVLQEEKAASKNHDQKLRAAQAKELEEFKLLLLGAGEAGKSTVFKQIKAIHDQAAYTEHERMKWVDSIHANVVSAVQRVITAVEYADDCNLSAEENGGQHAYEALKDVAADAVLTPDMAVHIRHLLEDSAVKTLLESDADIRLPDSAMYFVQRLDVVSQAGYVPSLDDVLRCRVRTSGITQFTFSMDSYQFKVLDVGGQRNERRKWIHCFEGVTAVIFVASLSEYDQELAEVEGINRMEESLRLFDEVCNSPWFAKTSLILFLNKSDLFEEKIKHTDLNVCFPEYKGGLDSQAAYEFIVRKFMSLNRNPSSKHVYIHRTCATSTDNIRFVFNAVKDIVLQDNLKRSGIL